MGFKHVVKTLLQLALMMLATSSVAKEAYEEQQTKSFDFEYLIKFINPFAKISHTTDAQGEHSLFYYFDLADKPVATDQEETSRQELLHTLEWPEDIWKPKGASNILRALFIWSNEYFTAQQEQLTTQHNKGRFSISDHLQQWAFPSPLQAWVSASYIDIYTGPSEDYPAFYIAEKHQRLLLLSTQADWVKIQVEDGTVGWIKDDDLLTRIKFQENIDEELESSDTKQVDKSVESKRFIDIGLHGGMFDSQHTLKASLQIPLFENISLSTSMGEIIGENSDAQIFELRLRHKPNFQLPWQTYFSLGAGYIFNASQWSGASSRESNADYISVGAGLSYPLSSRLSLSLDTSNYHAFFSDSYSASFQAYSLGVHFQNNNPVLSALEQSANKTLKRDNRMLGAYIGQYKTDSGYLSFISGLSFITLTSPNSFINIDWGQGELDTGPAPANDTALSYYRFMLAYIAKRSEFVTQQKSLRIQGYILTGPGSIRYKNHPSFTFNLGAGLLLETNKRAVLKLQAINKMVDSGLLEKDKITHNPELSIGVNLRF